MNHPQVVRFPTGGLVYFPSGVPRRQRADMCFHRNRAPHSGQRRAVSVLPGVHGDRDSEAGPQQEHPRQQPCSRRHVHILAYSPGAGPMQVLPF